MLQLPVLTVHRASRALAVEYANGIAARMVIGTVVKVRCVRSCHCNSGRAQPAVGSTFTVMRTEPKEEPATEGDW